MLSKKDLLKRWLDNHKQYCFTFQSGNENMEPLAILKQIEQFLFGVTYKDTIYILYIVSDVEGIIPVYIGRSNTPLIRWKSHLRGFIRGAGVYATWRKLLLDDTGKFKKEVGLFLIADSYLLQPPIPGFPCTIGSVEYQLVSLISDSYPDTLLNHEGNRR